MALGFYAIMSAFNERWIAAPTAVFVAHIMDILDGRVARWMGTSSRFGFNMTSPSGTAQVLFLGEDANPTGAIGASASTGTPAIPPKLVCTRM